MDERLTDNDALLKIMRDRMDEAQSAELPHHERASSDMQFAVGNHWPDDERDERDADGRPCLTVNIMAQNVRQVTGQIRSLNPAVRVAAADSEASKDVAEIIEGMVRHIEYRSDASSVYEAATESAAACSMGFWRIRTEYCDGDTFDQEILIERVHNPFSVFFDPFAKDPTRKDARYAFIVEEMPKATFTKMYPKAAVADFTGAHKGQRFEHWGKGESVVVAEYFWIDHKEHEVFLLPGGQVVRGPLPKTVKFEKQRTVKEPIVKWAKVSGFEVLEGPHDFPSRYIPIVAVTGEEWHLGEETYRSSVIRFAKDPQILYNYARSTQAEIAMNQPKAPYMVTAKQIAGLETQWNDASHRNRPYMVYNADPGAPAPQRVQPPLSSEAMLTEAQVSADDIKKTTGIYDASLGARSNETSGKAILARKEESQNATSIYSDNMVKGVQQTGCILVDMIPRIYDTKRVVRVLGEDGQEKMETINDILVTQDGIQPVNDMKIGKYDVRVQVGTSYSSRREEARDGMFEFLRVFPESAPMVGDLVAKMQDWPEADRVAERLRKALPPGIAEDDKEELTPEEMQAKADADAKAQAEQQAMQEAQQIDMRKAAAEAKEAEADARKAEAEAQKAEFEMAQISGHLDQIVRQRAGETVAALMQPQPQVPMIEEFTP